MSKKALITKTDDGRYVFAVYDQKGFAQYKLFDRTTHYQKKIRKIAAELGAEIPKRINWDELPAGNFIEKFDDEEEARIRA